MKRVVCSPSAVDRVRAAAQWVAERGRATELIVVAATSESAKELTRRASHGLGASFGWHEFTLPRLAWALAGPALAERGFTPIGMLALEAVCARILHRSAASGSLGRLSPIADRPGLPRALARTLTELRLSSVSGERLPDSDLAGLLVELSRELDHSRLADRAHLLQAAAEVARGHHPLTGKPLLLLDVPVMETLEVELVRALAAKTEDLLVTVPAGDDRTLHAFKDLAQPRTERAAPKTPLERLQAGLFSEIAEAAGTKDGVVVFSAPGESRECVEIARRIHKEAEAGIPFDAMAVILRSPTQYRPHVEEAFRRAGIPAHFAKGTAMPDPAGRAFLALLACAAEGLSASRFAEYLSVSEVPDATVAGAPPPALPAADRWVPPDDELVPAAVVRASPVPAEADDAAPLENQPVVAGSLRAPRLWERLLVDAAVIGGIDRWRRRLGGLHAKMGKDLSELEDPEDPVALRIRHDRHALEGLREYALPLLEELVALPRSAPWGTWLDRLGALATRALRHPARVLSVLAELAPMAEVGPVDLMEVRIVLEHRLADVVVTPTETRFGHVYVANVEEARGMVFDVAFVPGLAERLFPHKVAEDPILPDALRESIGAGLARNSDRAALERLALRLAVGAARKKVVVSYPRLDLEQSRPRTPSFYGLEVLRAAEGQLPGFDDLARRADVTGAARVGWPAPTSPEDAIDHAEHDLALLESIWQRDQKETVGAARYLLSTNEHLARALRFRNKRWWKSWTEADGIVSPSAGAAAALEKHKLATRSYSPTGLQNFAACPYRFVLQAIHRLQPREEPALLQELDPLQKGSLIHEVQFQLYSELREQGLLPVRQERLEETRGHLDRVLRDVADKYKDELAPAIERVWDDAIAAIKADLREWLRRVSLEPEWDPIYFELSFGLRERGERDPHSVEAPVPLDCGIQLRGSIDLVERSRAGSIRATDHKTGKVRAEQGAVIGGGEILQPVLYALALEKLLEGEVVEGGRLYYCTSTGDFTPVDVPLDTDAREAAKLVADTVHEALAKGFLPAAPTKGACEYCDYLRVCGPYEETRTERKKKEPLVPLQKLRAHR